MMAGTIPRKLYKIGEVMRHTGLSRQTIHNYTMLGLLTEEERTESGHRLYGEEVFERIERIKALREKKTLKEIISILKGQEGGGNAAGRRG
jgi:DNA-binding transcriptional MerR regulator